MVETLSGTKLQIEQDEGFQKRDWVAQRIAWVVFALVLLGAALGLFGSGPLSSASVSGDGWRLDYERFARRGRPMWLTLTIEHAAGDTVVVEFSQAYLDGCALERAIPDAREESAAGAVRRLEFAIEQGEPAKVLLRVEPRTIGLVRGTVGLEDGEAREFSTFVYP